MAPNGEQRGRGDHIDSTTSLGEWLLTWGATIVGFAAIAAGMTWLFHGVDVVASHGRAAVVIAGIAAASIVLLALTGAVVAWRYFRLLGRRLLNKELSEALLKWASDKTPQLAAETSERLGQTDERVSDLYARLRSLPPEIEAARNIAIKQVFDPLQAAHARTSHRAEAVERALGLLSAAYVQHLQWTLLFECAPERPVYPTQLKDLSRTQLSEGITAGERYRQDAMTVFSGTQFEDGIRAAMEDGANEAQFILSNKIKPADFPDGIGRPEFLAYLTAALICVRIDRHLQARKAEEAGAVLRSLLHNMQQLPEHRQGDSSALA